MEGHPPCKEKCKILDLIDNFSYSDEEEEEENIVNPTSSRVNSFGSSEAHGMNDEHRPQVSRKERNRLTKQRARRREKLRDENDQCYILMRDLLVFQNSEKKI